MTKTTRFGGLGGAMRSSSSAPAIAASAGGMKPGDEDTEAMEGDEEEEAEADAEAGAMEPEPEAAATPAPVAEAPAAGTAAAERARVAAVAKAVAEDKNCQGKADLALSMLADDDYAGLSASGIIKILGKQNSTTTNAASEGAEMMAQMREQGDIDTGAGGDEIDAAAENHGWGKAHAKVAKRFGTSTN